MIEINNIITITIFNFDIKILNQLIIKFFFSINQQQRFIETFFSKQVT